MLWMAPQLKCAQLSSRSSALQPLKMWSDLNFMGHTGLCMKQILSLSLSCQVSESSPLITAVARKGAGQTPDITHSQLSQLQGQVF